MKNLKGKKPKMGVGFSTKFSTRLFYECYYCFVKNMA